jgi:hypothetical protein
LVALDVVVEFFVVVGEAEFIVVTGRCELAGQDVGPQQSVDVRLEVLRVG